MPQRLDITQRLHQRMVEIVGTGLPLIASSIGDADLTGLAHLREEMVETMERYCQHVQGLCEAAHASGSKHDSVLSARLMEGCALLRGAYETFRARWAHRDTRDNWHEYRLSAIVMMKQIRDHVRRGEHLRLTMMQQAA